MRDDNPKAAEWNARVKAEQRRRMLEKTPTEKFEDLIRLQLLAHAVRTSQGRQGPIPWALREPDRDH